MTNDLNRRDLLVAGMTSVTVGGCATSAQDSGGISREAPRASKRASELSVDALVYCATPAGIMSAYTAAKAGLSVVVVEPSRWTGGILGAGIKPLQDMPNYEAVGGKTRELMLRLGVKGGHVGGECASREVRRRMEPNG